jgi:hypothetical protein
MENDVMGLLPFGLNVTLGGCVDYREGIAADETHGDAPPPRPSTGCVEQRRSS